MMNQQRINLFHLSPTSVYVRVSNWLERHPRGLRHAMRVGVAVMFGFTLLNAGLFTVQKDHTPAFMTINGKSYGLMPIKDAKQLLQTEHASTGLTIGINDVVVVLGASQSGVKVDTNKTFSSITDQSGWQRIPVVNTVGNLFTSVKPVYNVDQATLATALAPYITEPSVSAKNADVIIPSDRTKPVTIVPGTNGTELTVASAVEDLALSISKNEFTVKIMPRATKPRWTVLDMRAIMPTIEAARGTSMTIEADNSKVVLSAETLAPMLRVDTTGATLKMTLDTTLLKAYLDSQAKAFYTAAIATRTVQTDGTEVSRVDGIAGKQLDSVATAKLAAEAFARGVLKVTPAIVNLTPELLVSRNYSNTDQGLYKKIEDFAKLHKGTYGVVAIELAGGLNRSAFYNADEAFTTASTYKLFVAYGVMQKIEQGTWTMNTDTGIGTVGDCMYMMIHVSDNDCGGVLQKMLGYSSFAAQMKVDGFTETDLLNPTGEKYSTARDEMKLITKLYNHELLNADSTEYLFGLMKQQIYRNGIPAGSYGSVVADKVGMLYSFNHDIAVVYSPKSTYALVIMTEDAGGSANIKLLAQQIYEFYNQ